MLPETFGQRTSRRRFLVGTTVLAALPILQACSGAQAPPTTAPASTAPPAAPTATTAPAQQAAAPTATTAAAPATATTAAAPSQPTATPAAAAAPTGGGKRTIAGWTHDDGMVKFLTNRINEWAPSKTGWNIKPDIQVVVDPWTKELTALAAGQGAPDLFGVQVDNFSRFQKGDICTTAFVPINSLVQEVGGPQAFIKLSIYSWKGNNYAVDWAASPVVYFYREDLFQEAGVKLPLETFDDVISEGQKLKAKGRFMDQFFLEPTFWIAEFSRYLEGRNGQGVFDKEGKVLLDTPEAIDTLQFLSDFSHKNKLMDVFDTQNAQVVAYQRNLVAGTVMADWWAHYVMEASVKEQVGKWKAQLMPQQVKGVNATPTWGGIGTTISQKSPDRDLLLDLYKYAFMTKEHAVKVWTEIGFIPTMRATWTLPEVATFEYPTLGGQVWGPLVAKASNTLVDPYYGPFWTEHIPIIGKAVNAVLVDNAKPDDALKAAAKELRDLIAKG